MDRMKDELKDGIRCMVNLLLAGKGKADVEFSEVQDVLTAVIVPKDAKAFGLIVSKGGIGIEALRKVAVLGAKRRHLNLYITVKDTTAQGE